MNATWLVIAKEPIAGRVKTRLTPPCGPDAAALLADAALRDTIAAVDATPAERRVLVFDGTPPSWLPPDWEVRAQSEGGLDERLAAAFEPESEAALLVGMDTPQVTPALLTAAARAMQNSHGLLGPATDGGFWIVGMTKPDASVFRGVPMSAARTGTNQLDRLEERFDCIVEFTELTDVDRWVDAVAVARAAPTTRFASVVRRVGAELGGNAP